MARRLVVIKTYIPEKKVWVSTVAWDIPIGADRCAETMVFRGDEKGITDFNELYFESHGCETDEKALRKKHERIVEAIRTGKIKLARRQISMPKEEYVYEIEGMGRFVAEFVGAFVQTSSIAFRKLIDLIAQHRKVNIYRCEGTVCDKTVEPVAEYTAKVYLVPEKYHVTKDGTRKVYRRPRLDINLPRRWLRKITCGDYGKIKFKITFYSNGTFVGEVVEK